MDVYSMIATSMMVSVIVAILTILLSLSLKTREANYFGLGNMLFSLGLVLFVLQQYLPDFIAYVVPNSVLLLGLILIVNSVVMLHTEKLMISIKTTILFMVLIVILYIVFIYMIPSLYSRKIIFSISLAVTCFFCIGVVVWRVNIRDFNYSYKILLSIFALFGSINVIRIVITIIDKDIIKGIFFNDIFNTVYIILASCFLIGWSLQVLVVMVKKSENKLRQLNRCLEKKVEERTGSLERSIKDLKETQEKLISSEKFIMIGKLVSGIAHELNTPLGTAITSNSFLESQTQEFILNYESNKLSKRQFEQYTENVVKSNKILSVNLEKISQIVQTFKMIDSSYSFGGEVDFSLKDRVNLITYNLAEDLNKFNCIVQFECDDDLIVSGYPIAFELIFSNLIQNSLTHAFLDYKNNLIKIKVLNQKHHINILYEDNGVGFSNENLEHVFDPFYTTKKSKGNIGLGLYIVSNLVVQALNGTISCETSESGGLKFNITIKKPPNSM
ncbi:MAG: HAMP domain-containing histidine kinase [Clostridiales bacterium]|nr:HAMP domain-containing histidine kinase [Clostridiales bacterium]